MGQQPFWCRERGSGRGAFLPQEVFLGGSGEDWISPRTYACLPDCSGLICSPLRIEPPKGDRNLWKALSGQSSLTGQGQRPHAHPRKNWNLHLQEVLQMTQC